ncbi:MAG: hypothetical protein ACU0CA_04695 [Paracoccaceae bacterium]
MPKFIPILAAASLTLSLAATPSIASKESDQAAAAALLLLGIAALAHTSDHHADGKHYTNSNNVADFERGYNDGLYNARYDSRHSTVTYGDGFSAGLKERDNRLAHRRYDAPKKTPTKALKSCIHKAAQKWGRNKHELHVTNSRKGGAGNYHVEISSGHKHGNCKVEANGKILSFKKGRI